MMDLRVKYGRTALIAGATEGIGEAYARYLAAAGMDLILVARRPAPLQALTAKLSEEYNVNATSLQLDLSEAGATGKIREALDGIEVSMMVYNAALSGIGPFIENSEEYLQRACQVNMVTPLELAHHFGRKMIERRKGAVILMASLAGMQGSGYLSVYAATKAFNRVLAESLWYEWKENNVDIIACIAGATATPGYISSEPGYRNYLAPRVLAPDEIPAECFMKLGRTPSFITGRGNRIASFFMNRILPVRTAVKIMGNNTRKMYRL
jgi:short-subunit dehydrogenase